MTKFVVGLTRSAVLVTKFAVGLTRSDVRVTKNSDLVTKKVFLTPTAISLSQTSKIFPKETK